jgi:4-amino-4-deoxy-L-arabinose transferase-like glycosyltransferase
MSASSHAVGAAPARWAPRARSRVLELSRSRGELFALIALAGTLNLWALSRNGWANTYYSAAVRSMSTSWHNFLFASLDPSGVMTVDKPPLALWVQALSVRVFGYHSLSILVPEALMGIASVVLLYDLVRRRFGRLGGFAAGLALAVTPMTVAISRHNNPDSLLILCSVAALWCAVRALEDGRTRWLVASGVAVGLGFETKMGVALVVVPGIVVAWLYLAPALRGRLHAMRQLLAAGGAMLLVGGAWPLLVELTPAADRPWVSGTSDNRILSLIFEYNGVGRVDGQSGGPGGTGGNLFGGTPGPLRLLNSALGGQAGWLLGFALVSGLGILVATRLRRSDPRTGWLLVLGGALVTTGVLFSAASGIFHPYYVSLLAPFIAAFAGAGLVHMTRGGLGARIIAPLAIIAGVVTELIVAGNYTGQLTWLPPVLIAAGVLSSLALIAVTTARVRLIAGGVALGALLLAPSVWAVDTLGYATSSTFPSGGPASAENGGGGAFGGPGGFGGSAGRGGGRAFGGGGGEVNLFGNGSQSATGTGAGTAGAGAPTGEGFGAGQAGSPPTGTGTAPGAGTGGLPGAGAAGGAPSFGGGGAGGFGPGAAGAGGGGFGGDGSINTVLSYVRSHGGGTLAVSSQSSAAQAIISENADVAGIGGFSGRESDVSISWLAQEVRSGKIRWVLAEETGGFGGRGGLPGDNRVGAKKAISAVEQACRKVTVSSSAAASGTEGGGESVATSAATLYDCRGDAGALAAL